MDKTEIIKIAVEAGVSAAIKHIGKHKKQQTISRHDKRLHNTKLLLKHYNLFKDHCEKSIDNFQQAVEKNSENALDILDALEQCDDNAYIQSIKRSVTRTYTIMTHVSEMLGLYEAYCERSNRPEELRRYRVLRSYYIDNVKIPDIASMENIDERTYYRDINESLEKLSALMFGIDSINEMSETCQ